MKMASKPLWSQAQKEIVMHEKGALRVCAGPGTGKTTVMVARAKRLCEKLVEPGRVLIITYSRRAADEIREQFEKNRAPVVKTLHAIGYQIIQRNHALIGEKKLATHVDHMLILQELLTVLPRIPQIDTSNQTRWIQSMENLLKTFDYINELGEEEYEKKYPDKNNERLMIAKSMYEQKMTMLGYITYDEQIQYAVSILEKHSHIRQAVAGEYDYIHVDETQDMDEDQIQLIRLMVKEPEHNIAVFGDVDQAIYSFRGGSTHLLLNFKEYYPDATDIVLDKNYRSTQEILNTANVLIRHNQKRVSIETESAYGFCSFRPVWLANFRAGHMGNLIREICRKAGCSLNQVAIISRTNVELERLGNAIDYYNGKTSAENRIKYELPKYYLRQDPVFQLLLDILAIAVGRYNDNNTWIRLLSALGFQTVCQKSNSTIYEEYISAGEIYAYDSEEASLYYVLPECKTGIIRGFAKIYQICQFFYLPLETAVRKAAAELCDKRISRGMDSLRLICNLIHDRQMKSPQELWKYMNGMRLFQDNTRIQYTQTADHLHMLTAHDAKGRQFQVVIIYGADKFETGDIEEDRRLLYVAMTRAEKYLFMTEEYMGRSTLLGEIGQNMNMIGGKTYA